MFIREAAASTCKIPIDCLSMIMDGIEVPFDDESVNIADYTVETTNMFNRRSSLSIPDNKVETCQPIKEV